jgi:hypothetical protein
MFCLAYVLMLSLALVLGPDGGLLQPGAAQAKITDGMADRAPAGLPFNEEHPGVRTAMAVQERHTPWLMDLPEVVGTATGVSETGEPAVLVFLKAMPPRGLLPGLLDGVPVVATVSGEFRALAPPTGSAAGGGGFKTTSKLLMPVPIGVSTGNENECSAGTIGARVKDDRTTYALSNNHVYARENDASVGESVLQPGLYDTKPKCVNRNVNTLGSLTSYVPLKFDGTSNTIDAAIAATTVYILDNRTPPDGYGIPNSTAVAAEVGMSVQKYGRTTKLTVGTIYAINAIVNVAYSSGTARFVNQIVITPGGFSRAGDSGSLIVTYSGKNPVGLLFAGSSTYTIANRIGDVLGAYNVSIDGE